MKITVLAVGKIREKDLRRVADEYVTRVRHYVRCEEIETRDAAALERALPPDALLIALEVAGSALTSEEFARRIEAWSRTGKGHIAFAIGGAEGLPAAFSRQAQFRLSLSSMTFPHRLARVVLFEQLYRAMTIQRGEPYAREG